MKEEMQSSEMVVDLNEVMRSLETRTKGRKDVYPEG